jgi:hypothetical protein
MALHQRSEKNRHLDTILYEIDMLRHCEGAVRQKAVGVRAPDAQRADYYLALEGFLLHLRNLFAFLGSYKSKDTDIVLGEPKTWAGRHIEPREYSGLIKGCRELDRKYGARTDSGNRPCRDEISKYLQHCTTFRYERAKHWPVEEIYADINSLLQEFETCFAADVAGVRAINDFPTDTAGNNASFGVPSSLSDENG